MKTKTKRPPNPLRVLSQSKPGALSQTVGRALAILRTFDRDQNELGVTEISERLAVQIMSTPPHQRASLGAARGHDGSASAPTTTAP